MRSLGPWNLPEHGNPASDTATFPVGFHTISAAGFAASRIDESKPLPAGIIFMAPVKEMLLSNVSLAGQVAPPLLITKSN
jgi:hypothetical protein